MISVAGTQAPVCVSQAPLAHSPWRAQARQAPVPVSQTGAVAMVHDVVLHTHCPAWPLQSGVVPPQVAQAGPQCAGRSHGSQVVPLR
jgi:hypothetical protein